MPQPAIRTSGHEHRMQGYRARMSRHPFMNCMPFRKRVDVSNRRFRKKQITIYQIAIFRASDVSIQRFLQRMGCNGTHRTATQLISLPELSGFPLKQRYEGVAALAHVSNTIDFSCRKAVGMLSMPCLVNPMNIGHIRECREAEPHLHIVRMSELLLAADNIDKRLAHQDFG